MAMEIEGRTLIVSLPDDEASRLLSLIGPDRIRSYVLDRAGAALKYEAEKDDLEVEIHEDITLPAMWARGAASNLRVKAASLRARAAQMMKEAENMEVEAAAKAQESEEIAERIKYRKPRLDYLDRELKRTLRWRIDRK